MAYNYYQQAQPGWGTSQFQFGPPPTPNFQSQPNWGGMDFYRAHAQTSDPSLFDHAWNRVRDYSGSSIPGVGVGLHEARHWHRLAYGGIGELSRMLPAEIGHAAAYEAYRTWIHNSSIYEPLSGDVARQREGLIGLAVAEATRLLPFAGRQMDHYSHMAASDAAAATASVIFFQSREERDGGGYRRSRSLSRPGSSSSYGDYYANDDALTNPYYRSQSRHRSRSRSRARPVIQIPGGGAGYSPMSGGGYPGSGYATPIPPGVASSYGGQSSYSPYGGGGMPMTVPPGTPYPQTAMPMGVPGSYQGSSMPMGVPGSYQGSGMPMGIPMSASSHHRGRTSSMSYGQAPYMGTAMSTGGMQMGTAMGAGGMQMVPPGPQTIIVTKPHRKHKHRHSSRSHRSRSIEPYVDHYPHY
ncbi:hypothetical protein Hypma_008059 [Hypsizygus marmoreus]|uniref:Uncharacterized protein n=1 Tax=Hypsizygus marmoreus TaxID=39966 RepID=A0A369JSN4_HYPMA|nr:hypothetical protein Hypma_008059 [Hypsizygus marmoreus]